MEKEGGDPSLEIWSCRSLNFDHQQSIFSHQNSEPCGRHEPQMNELRLLIVEVKEPFDSSWGGISRNPPAIFGF
jgi:hypothetical protein